MRVLAAVLATVILAACGPRPGSSAAGTTTPGEAGKPGVPPPKVIELEALRIDVVTTKGGQQSLVYDARSLLEDGNDALMQRHYDEALVAFDHLLRDFPDSRLAAAALYNAGLALEGKEDWPAAAQRYRDVVSRSAARKEDAETVKDAQFRLGAVLAESQQWAEATRVFEAVLDRNDLSASERVEALARLGYILVEAKDFAGAEEVLRSALAFHRQVQATEKLDNNYYVAMCQYYLADIPHRQFNDVPLRYPEEQLSKDVDFKSELMLLARDRYIKTVDYKNAFWATAAVYQIGLMYKEFWDDFMAVPIPTNLKPVEVQAYIKAVNEEEQLRKLLEKSLLYHQRNLEMAKNASVQTIWVDASLQGAEDARKILAKQHKGELITPGKASVGKVEALDPGLGGKAPTTDYVPPRLDL
jgi:cellulose synthase operon protein C